MDTYNRSIRGLKSRSNGEYFERMIIAASRFYEDRGIAVIDKTPEAFKVIKPYNRDRGQFICCFTQQAQPDFKGALMDSTMVLFDAKHTDKGQISRNVVTEEQEECFERYMKMGAMCFLVISLEFEEFYRVPWIVFRDMKKIYGHKYMNREELAPYRVKYSKYFDYNRFFMAGKMKTYVSRLELVAAMTRAKMCTEEKKPAVFEMNEDQLNIRIADRLTDYQEEVKLQDPIPEPLKIGFDSKLVLETLKAFTCENIAMNFSGPKMPAVVEAEDSDMKAIVLPVMIREE